MLIGIFHDVAHVLGLLQPLGMLDIELCAQLLALVAIENTHGNLDAEADVRVNGRIVPGIDAEGGIGRAVGHREPVVHLGFIDGLHGGFQIGPRRAVGSGRRTRRGR
jgi:hypothetical protein